MMTRKAKKFMCSGTLASSPGGIGSLVTCVVRMKGGRRVQIKRGWVKGQ